MDKMENLQVRKVKQKFDTAKIENISQYIDKAFAESDISRRVSPGDRIAVTAGSRGISRISEIIKSVVNNLKDLGTNPFIIPAMGSHGGANASGQEGILEAYGITEESLGVPLKSSLDTVTIGKVEKGVPVHFSREALEADGIIALNRVKMHTDFHSQTVESGMSKILVIGLGKHKGASSIHSLGV